MITQLWDPTQLFSLLPQTSLVTVDHRMARCGVSLYPCQLRKHYAQALVLSSLPPFKTCGASRTGTPMPYLTESWTRTTILLRELDASSSESHSASQRESSRIIGVFLLIYNNLTTDLNTYRLGTSLACNFLPFGADVTALCPKYCNIIRGQVRPFPLKCEIPADFCSCTKVICLILAFAITPWHILTSAPTFLNFLG